MAVYFYQWSNILVEASSCSSLENAPGTSRGAESLEIYLGLRIIFSMAQTHMSKDLREGATEVTPNKALHPVLHGRLQKHVCPTIRCCCDCRNRVNTSKSLFPRTKRQHLVA